MRSSVYALLLYDSTSSVQFFIVHRHVTLVSAELRKTEHKSGSQRWQSKGIDPQSLKLCRLSVLKILFHASLKGFQIKGEAKCMGRKGVAHIRGTS